MPKTDLPTRILLLCPADWHGSQAWQDMEGALKARGCTVLANALGASRHSLVQAAVSSRAELVLWIATPDDDLNDALVALNLPVVCIAPHTSPTQRRQGFNAGVQVWLDALPASAEALHPQLQWACWQAARLSTLNTQMADRIWTDKAKGLLMAARTLDEPTAFRLLREAAMLSQMKLGEVSRAVVRAAALAEAINLAGQQRMLSQRLVKLLAQRAAAIEPRRAKALQDESCARVETNLARLQQLAEIHGAGATLALTQQAWGQLRPLLTGKPSAALLTQADAAAERLLALAEQLSTEIETAGAGRPLRLVNLCGRQRMLSQRLAKDALLADLLPGIAPSRIAEGLTAFEAGLIELETAPLSSSDIRALLADVRDEWGRLLRSVRDVQGPEAAAGLARSSESLLSQLDQLTGLYQQSLQLILG
jgi:AmiR/NasT family two-component response regulator